MVYSKLRFCSLELSRFGGNILDSRLVESTNQSKVAEPEDAVGGL